MWLTDFLLKADRYFQGFQGNHRAAVGALIVLLGSTFALGYFNPKNEIKKRLGHHYFSSDTAFGYSAADLYAVLDRYERGRGGDFSRHKCFIYLDLVFPFVYAFAAALLIGYLLPVLSPEEYTRIRFLTLIPVTAALFDLLENASMWLVLDSYERAPTVRRAGLVRFSSAMTMLKLILIYATVFLVLFGLIRAVAYLICGKSLSPAPPPGEPVSR